MENAAAANIATRIGYGSTGLTPSLVVTASEAALGSANAAPRIWINKGDPNAMGGQIYSLASALEKGQGGVFVSGGNLVVMAADDAGLAAVADAYSARAPYQWKVPGDKFAAIPDAVNAAGHGTGTLLQALIYAHGEQGIHRAVVHADFSVTAAQLAAAFDGGHLAAVRELVVLNGTTSVTATNPKPLPAAASTPATAAVDAPSAGAAETGALGAAAGEAGAAGGGGCASRNAGDET